YGLMRTPENVAAEIPTDYFFEAEDGIRDRNVTGVQTCALPILGSSAHSRRRRPPRTVHCAPCEVVGDDDCALTSLRHVVFRPDCHAVPHRVLHPGLPARTLGSAGWDGRARRPGQSDPTAGEVGSARRDSPLPAIVAVSAQMVRVSA